MENFIIILTQKQQADIVGDERLSKLELYVGDNLNNYIIEKFTNCNRKING